MKELCFFSLMQPAQASGSHRSGTELVRVPSPGDRSLALDLVLSEAGRLEPLPVAAPLPEEHDLSGARLAQMSVQITAAGPAWWLLSHHPLLTLNGLTPLPLAALEPGDLLAVEAQWWLVTSQWIPEPGPAPPELAQRPCAVCGGALALAPVCPCPCGRWYHLEDPNAIPNEQLLNCYLAGPCGLCGRLPTLEPAFLPEVPEKLLDEQAMR